MRHTDVARFSRVAEYVVTTLHIPQLPPIGFKQLDNLLAHGGYYNHQT